MSNAKIITGNGITVYYCGKVYTVSRDHKLYENMIVALNNNDYLQFVDLYDSPAASIINLNTTDGNKRFTKDSDGHLCFITKDKKVKNLDNVILERIEEMLSESVNMDDMVLFLDNLYSNPSHKSIAQAYNFLQSKNMPITNDGCFLAYKCVDKYFNSKTKKRNLTLISGRYNDNNAIYNGIGEVVECERNEVDDDSTISCGHGLHVGNLEYSGPSGSFHDYGDKIIIVKVNPRDIVSIPSNESSKMRVCKYEVASEFTQVLPNVIQDEYEEDEEWEDEEWDDMHEIIDESEEEEYEEGDAIAFDYDGKTRYAMVKSQDEDCLHCILLYKDPSFNPEEVSYRNFAFDKMSKIRIY